MKKTDQLRHEIRSKEEGSILAVLFRNIIRDLNLVHRFDGIIRKAAVNPKQKKNKTEHAIGNLVCGEKMTFKVFIFILRDVLNVSSFKLTIELTHSNGRETIHSVPQIKLKDIIKEKDESSNGKTPDVV